MFYCLDYVFAEIKENSHLHELLYLVLIAGNYLNNVSCYKGLTSKDIQ